MEENQLDLFSSVPAKGT